MAALKRYRPVLAVMAVLVLAIRIAAAVLCHTPMAGAGAPIVDPVLGTIEICTSHGLERLTGPAEGDTRQQPAKPDPCSACLLGQAIVLTVLLALAGVLLSAPATSGWIAAAVTTLAVQFGSLAHRSRAPPVPA